jgi:S-(hydroxymethyl)glutathione dehydrogenase/alcohol dehydrogenase
MKFRAAVLHDVGKPMPIETVEMTGLKSGDVLVRMRASGLCHTDLEVIQGSLRYPLPIVLGHEGAGVVEAVGPGVTRVKPGDHVICSWNPHCGHCFYCERDQPILCEVFAATQPAGHLMDGTSRLTVGGRKLHHYSEVSSHAECAVVPESGAVPIPKETPFDRACLVGCGVMTGIGAALRYARVEAGASALVIGCGAVGLNAVQGCRLARAEPIVAVDVNPERLSLAQPFGATHLVNPKDGDAVAAVKALTSGRGADYVLECAGNEAGFRLSVEAARPGASITWLGKTDVSKEVSFRWGTLMGERRIVRSSYGGARPMRDFPWLCRLYLDGELKLDELIGRRIALDEINQGFADMEKAAVVRTVIEFPG